MRLLSVPLSLFLALASATGEKGPVQDRVSAAAAANRLGEFLSWAHPAGGGCEPPSDVSIVDSWEGGLRARYTIVCGSSSRALQGVFMVREKEGVWQIAAGFEGDAARIDAGLGASGSAPAGLAPPGGAGISGEGRPFSAVLPPEAKREVPPEYPEEAGRARLIGEAHVELLVQVSPDGTPLRSRPLRGPDPDLGMRRAAAEALLRWRFEPARLAGEGLTYFRPVDMTFAGLPPESRDWEHRALFHVEAIVSDDDLVVEEAFRRVRSGEPFEAVAARSIGPGPAGGGDWGFVSAATLPAAVRKALHEARIGELAGPVTAEGLHYLLLKRGEVYYAILPRSERGASYKILHQRSAPEEEALTQAILSDIADYLAESRRQTFMNEAARLMGIKHSLTESGRLEIHTDVLDKEETRMLGQVVEAAFRAHEKFWAPLVPLRPFKQQILVYAWARQADHDRMHRLWRSGRKGVAGPQGTTEPPAARPKVWSFSGEYIPASRILSVPCERIGGHLPIPILVHEAIHMLDYERTYGAGVVPSQWFQEGLATYYGFSQIGASLDIEPGDIRRSGTIVSGQVRLQFDPRTPLHEYLKRIQGDGPVALRALLVSKAGDPLWGGDRPILAYGASWTLVHFLLHGSRGAHREAFKEYARSEAQGQGGLESFVRLFGPDLTTLEDAWHRYEEDL